MKHILITFLLITSFSFAGMANDSDKKRSIEGTVIEQGTSDELTGVKVSVVGTDIVVYTDEQGRFEIDGVTVKDVTLEFSFISFEKQQTVLSSNVPSDVVVELLPR